MSERISSDDKIIIKDAQELYSKGMWAEAINLIDTIFTSSDELLIAEANRIKGWCYYYLGIKGDENYKIENMEKAEECFKLSLIGTKQVKTKISALNGLPLTLWILGKKSEAWEISDKTMRKFSKVSSVFNTGSILARWGKEYEKSKEICQKVYETALIEEDFRTAGHGKQNRGDALVELGKITEAKEDYEKALEMYKKYEKKTGESAKFHIEGIEKKLSNL